MVTSDTTKKSDEKLNSHLYKKERYYALASLNSL